MDVWQEVREKLAYNEFNNQEMYEQTHNPISSQGVDTTPGKGPNNDAEAIKEMYRIMYKNKRARKNLV